MTETLRIALVGGGKMALQHATAIRVCNGAQLVAVVDPAIPTEELRTRFGAEVEPFADLEAMLDQAKPDVVHVVTPPDTHAAIAAVCLEAGAHVYVEKPFALAEADAAAVLDLAERKQLRVCAAHQVLFQDSARAYRTDLPVIGDVRHVESFFSFKPVRRRAGGSGLSSPVDQLVDILPHPVYLLLDALPRDGAAELSAFDVDPAGEVRAVLRRGGAMATLVVSLRARPVESYLRVMGSNGSIHADFVIGYVVRHPGPGASAPSVVLKPFSSAWQIGWGSLKGLFRLVFRKQKSYPGLAELLERFYSSITGGGEPPMNREDILDTVRICAEIDTRLRAAEAQAERVAAQDLELESNLLIDRPAHRGTVLLTGGTGMLGRPTAVALREAGWRVRIPARRPVPASERLPGVEYVEADLGGGVDDGLLADVDLVVHAAAETAGGQPEHERNTVQATRNLLDAMQRSGVRRLINIGSVAVLKPSTGGTPLREESPVDHGNLSRGPYVWAKAEAEVEAVKREKAGDIDLRTIRLGPLVDYDAYTPPGRLGREVARLFVAMGSRKGPLAVCSVATAAAVITHYAGKFEAAPPYVNLLEVPVPRRGELADRLRAFRPDLIFLWLPFPVLRVMSGLLRVALRVLRPRAQALDLYSAFKSESYDPTIAGKVIAEIRQ